MMLRIILTIGFVILCVAMIAIVLMQEGKSSGLRALSGAAESYVSKNKGNTFEGKLEKYTKYVAVLIFVFAIILNLNF